MWALVSTLIAVGTAILTSWLTDWFERRRRKREYELKWLEERFTPALNFLGRVSAITGSVPNTQEGRKQVADEIRNIVVGASTESNARCIAALLDPEDTGLSDLIFSAMTYARIAESEREFNDYRARLHWNLKELAEEFRREREAIASGKSLESLIRKRKSELEENVRRMGKALDTLRAFLDGKANLDSTLREVEGSGVRGVRLSWVFEVVSREAGDQQGQARIEEVRRACEERGWLSEGLRKQG